MFGDISKNIPGLQKFLSFLRRRPRQLGPVNAVVWLGFVFIGSQFVAGFLLELYPLIRNWDNARTNSWLNTATSAQFAFTVLTELLVIGLIWLLVRHYSLVWAAIGWVRPRLRNIIQMLAGFGVYFVAYIAIVIVVAALVPSFKTDQVQDVGFNNVTGNAALIMTFISLAVLAPLAEEIMFRGFLFTGVRRKFPFILTAIIVSALFASPHLLQSTDASVLWVAGLDTFVLSLVLCYLREKTGSLWPGIGVHVVKNGIAFTMLFVLHA